MSFAFALEFLMAAMAVAYLISSVLRGSTGALVLTFFLFVMILPIVDAVSMFAGVKIDASLTFASGAMMYSMYDPYPQDEVFDEVGFTIHQYYPDQAVAAFVMLVYALVSVALSLFLFKRKQLTG
jgi:ABC-type transport system involved in multi-copper enzyme maturation permease subunit